MNLRERGLAGLLAVLALALASCGDSDESTTTTVTITKKEFVKKANQICARGDDEINADFEKYSEKAFADGKVPSSANQAKASQRIVLPVVSREVEEFRALGIPSEGEQQVLKMIEAYEKGIEAGEENFMLMLGTNSKFPLLEAYALASDYGIDRCFTG